MRYKVMEEHHSNYPNPITIEEGTKLRLGDKYTGAENWDNWRFCYTLGGETGGWVPEQILVIEGEYGVALEDYTAKELNAKEDEIVEGIRELNGWLWCIKLKDGDEGWLPEKKLIRDL